MNALDKNFMIQAYSNISIYIENDRVVISHDEKPSRDIIDAIKKNGFRWSPKFGNWCRKHTGNARRDAKYLLINYFGGKL